MQRIHLGSNPSLVGAAVTMIAAAFVFAWGWLSAPPTEIADVLSVGLMLAACVAAIFVVGTTRVVGGIDGHLDLVDLVVVRRVPVEQIARVVAARGLRVVLTSGAEVGSSAYGPSLAGQLAGYPRSVEAAQRIEHFLRSLPASAWRPPGERAVQTRVRVLDIIAGLELGAFLLLGTVLLHVLRSG